MSKDEEISRNLNTSNNIDQRSENEDKIDLASGVRPITKKVFMSDEVKMNLNKISHEKNIDRLDRLHNRISSLDKPYKNPPRSKFYYTADSSELKKRGSMLPSIMEAKRRHIEENRIQRMEAQKGSRSLYGEQRFASADKDNYSSSTSTYLNDEKQTDELKRRIPKSFFRNYKGLKPTAIQSDKLNRHKSFSRIARFAFNAEEAIVEIITNTDNEKETKEINPTPSDASESRARPKNGFLLFMRAFRF